MATHRRAVGTYTGMTPEREAEERYADAFAATLLMPEAPFRQEWKRTRGNLALTAYRFGVSAEHAHYRARLLGLAE